KRCTSYIRAEMLDGVDVSQIHARLFDLTSNSDHEFTPIMENNRTQYVCKTYLFRFFTALGDIKSYFCDTSKWTDKILWLSDLQLTSYYYWQNIITNIENGIINAEKIMKNTKKNDDNDD
ncbi:8579_t:CDS:1, partial [Funneliformis caledonium]